MDLYLIRHGESVNNILADKAQHLGDPPLTHRGKEQAAQLAAYLAQQSIGVTHFYCSPMQRALQTAHPVAQALDLIPDIWLHIHEEGGVGKNEKGMSRLEIAGLFPGCRMPEDITEAGWWHRTETLEGCYERAGEIAVALDTLAAENPDGKMLLITHGTFISVLLKVILQMPPDDAAYFVHDNTGITLLRYAHQRKYIRYVNRVEHLTNAGR